MKMRILIVGSMLLASSTFANIGKSGNSRCGLGTMIFGSMDGSSSHVTEESTNTFYLNSSISITFGTSGCSNSGFVNVKQSELLYANTNIEELVQEISLGQGEVLDGLAEIMGCPESTHSTFGKLSKQNARDLIKDSESARIISTLRTNIQKHKILSKKCVG